MNCPQCNVNLLISSRQGIEIDYCPQCRGVWLDRGELDKILEREMEMVPPSAPRNAPPPYGQADVREERPRDSRDDRRYDDRRRYDDDDDDRYRKRKKGGFLGELFDFD